MTQAIKPVIVLNGEYSDEGGVYKFEAGEGALGGVFTRMNKFVLRCNQESYDTSNDPLPGIIEFSRVCDGTDTDKLAKKLFAGVKKKGVPTYVSGKVYYISEITDEDEDGTQIVSTLEFDKGFVQFFETSDDQGEPSQEVRIFFNGYFFKNGDNESAKIIAPGWGIEIE